MGTVMVMVVYKRGTQKRKVDHGYKKSKNS